MNTFFYEFDIGYIGITENDEKITDLIFLNDELPKDIQVFETPLLKETERQLKAYFKGELKEFTIPTCPKGTIFMNRVWASINEIPYGETSTYKDIAAKIGKPNASRAVGLAASRNPILIFTPCHRVIASDGSIKGYNGGIKIKKKLLELECLG